MSWNQRLNRLFSCLAIASLSVATSSGANAAMLVADYRFQNTFASSVPGAPDLTVVGSGGTFPNDTVDGQMRIVFDFNTGTGLKAKTTGLLPSDNYSIVLLVALDVVGTSITKLIDFKNLTSDTGVYVDNGFVSFHDNLAATGGTVIVPQDYVQFVLTRDGTTVAAYVNGTQEFSFTDSGGLGVISGDDFLTFFLDDGIDTLPVNEDSNGRVARIRLFDGALAESEVVALDRAAAVPEPSSLALIAVGLGLTAFGRRRHKQTLSSLAIHLLSARLPLRTRSRPCR